MKSSTLMIRTAAAIGGVFFFSMPAMATEENGVTCRAGTTAVKNANHTNLKCFTSEKVTRESNCLSLTNGVGGFINGLQQAVKPGPDMCTDPTSRANAGAPKPMLLPGDPPNGWTREDTPGGRDIFVMQVNKFEFPQGAVFNPLDSEAKGVSCPSSFPNGESTSGGRGITCEKSRRVTADCDTFWTLRVDDQGGNRDKCIGVNGVGSTKPEGMPNAVYQTQLGRWKLDVNNGPDNFRHFGFPVSGN